MTAPGGGGRDGTAVTGRSPYNVLFLCTGNSARSILGEVLVTHWGRGRFAGYSAGSHPKGAVHPIALGLLRQMNLPIAGLRSKSWEEFAQPGAPRMDFVFTVCDSAAAESCPVWPGQPMTAHWGIEDPAAVEGPETERWLAFRAAFRALENRIKAFTSLPIASLDRLRLQERLDETGACPAMSDRAARSARAGGNRSVLRAATCFLPGTGPRASMPSSGRTPAGRALHAATLPGNRRRKSPWPSSGGAGREECSWDY